jgi:hypothetical protein
MPDFFLFLTGGMFPRMFPTVLRTEGRVNAGMFLRILMTEGRAYR